MFIFSPMVGSGKRLPRMLDPNMQIILSKKKKN